MIKRTLRILMTVIFLVVSHLAPAFAKEDLETLRSQQVEISPEDVQFLEHQKIQFKDNQYQLALEKEDLKYFDELDSEKQQKFLKVRKSILAKLVAIFSVAKVFVGFGAVAKNKLTFWRPEQRSLSEIYQESSQRVTEKMLTAMDKQLWESAAVIANSNETAITITPRAMLGLSIRDKGFMPGVGLGFTFAYNHQTNDFVFEIYSEYLKIKDSYPVAAGAYGSVALGLRVSRNYLGSAGEVTTSKLVFLPGPFALSQSAQQFGLYVAPSVSLGLFNVLLEAKEYKILSFKQRRKSKASKNAILSCRQVHSAVSF